MKDHINIRSCSSLAQVRHYRLDLNSDGLISIDDIVGIIVGPSTIKDFNLDGTFDHDDVIELLGLIKPIVPLER